MTTSDIRKRIYYLLSNENNLDNDKRMQELMYLVPELRDMYRLPHEQPAHCYDVFEHTLSVVDKMPENEIGKLAALFHDIGKPKKKVYDVNGVAHYWGHPEISYEMTRKILKRLEYPSDTIEIVSGMCRYHDSYINKTYDDFLEVAYQIGFENINLFCDLQLADLFSHASWYTNKHKDVLRAAIDDVQFYLRKAKGEKLY